MRKLLAALAISALWMFFSCNKLVNEDAPDDLLVAKWNLERIDYTEVINGPSFIINEPANPGNFLDFKKNGTLIIRSYGDEGTGSWSLTITHLA